MIEDQWLADAKFTTVRSGTDLSRVKSSKGDFQTASLALAVNLPETNALIVRSWLATAADRRSTLVFCVDLVHVAALSDEFRARGIDARIVTSHTHIKVRAERLAAFKAREFPVLLNCGIYTEGTDIPNVDCVLLARPTQSQNLLVQMVGRGLRKCEGKTDCHVIDIVANLEKGIVTTPTLFGLDPDELVKNADATALKALKDRKDQQRQREEAASVASRPAPSSDQHELTFTHYDNINDLLAHTSDESQIRRLSVFAWVTADRDKYVLSDISGSFLIVKRESPNHFSITLTARIRRPTAPASSASTPASDDPSSPPRKVAKSPFMHPRVIGTAPDLKAAIAAADTYAQARFMWTLIRTRSKMRRSPPSLAQIAFLNKLLPEEGQLDEDDVRIDKGTAADWITKIKHGARGRLARMKREKESETREEVKRMRWGGGLVLEAAAKRDASKALNAGSGG